jgi:hypothetical protein
VPSLRHRQGTTSAVSASFDQPGAGAAAGAWPSTCRLGSTHGHAGAGAREEDELLLLAAGPAAAAQACAGRPRDSLLKKLGWMIF